MTPAERLTLTRCGYHLLRSAYAMLKAAGCRQSAPRVRATLKSVQGAVRHAEGRRYREPPPANPRHGWLIRNDTRPGRTGYRADRLGVTMSARGLATLERMIDARHEEERVRRALRD